MGISLDDAGSAIAAIAALGTAAFGLVDASKGVYGGVSAIGWPRVKQALKPFAPALTSKGADWMETIYANWINGLPKEDQKSAAKSLVRLGLNSTNAGQMAAAGRVDPDRLGTIIKAVEQGTELTPDDVSLLARFDAAIDAALDAGFERGDQQYRTIARLIAGVVAIILAVGSNWVFNLTNPWIAFLVGLIAVPLAPVAKDLTTAISAAAGALKGGK